MRIRSLALVVMCGLWSCSSGGSTQSMTATVPNAATSPAVTSSPAAVAASARFTITVPAQSTTSSSARTPKFVSPATQSIIITLVSVGGVPFTGTPASIATNLSSLNPACTGTTTLTCSVTAPAIVGNDVFTVATYSVPAASAAPANLLSRAALTVAVTAGVTNAPPLALNGVVDHVTVGLSSSTFTEGTPITSGAPVVVTVNAFDGTGHIIVGSGNYVDANGNPLTITLTNSDTSGATTLIATGITAPSMGGTLTYTGGSLTSLTVSAAVSGGTIAGGTAAPVAFTVGAPTITALSGTRWVPGASSFALSETLTGTNFLAGTNVVLGGTGVTASNVSVTNSTTLTATFTIAANATVGPRNVTVSTVGGTSAAQILTLASGSIVTRTDDTVPGALPGTGTGASGDLRFAILNANANDTIVFNCGTPVCTITLAGPLPPIAQNLTIDGYPFGHVIVDGASTYRALWVDSGSVLLANLQIQNAMAQGGSGGAGNGGGGGAGVGAGLFINQAGAVVSVVNDYFLNCGAVGGSGGGISNTSNGGGGGGGLGGAGGTGSGGGGGGGGLLSNGGDSSTTSGASGGVGFTAGTGGLGVPPDGTPGSGGLGGGGGGAGARQNIGAPGGSGGSGGFGGGGGGGGSGTIGVPTSPEGVGGVGGIFGGGGGGTTPAGHGGAGGMGGGGGGSASGGSNGGALATVSGGLGGSTGNGGGGAAAGPAIFVNAGSVTTVNSGASGSAATGGAAGGSSPPGTEATAGTADPTPVFNLAGHVNGSVSAGPVSSALSGAMPTAIHRRS